jgi:hypothetical protein
VRERARGTAAGGRTRDICVCVLHRGINGVRLPLQWISSLDVVVGKMRLGGGGEMRGGQMEEDASYSAETAGKSGSNDARVETADGGGV